MKLSGLFKTPSPKNFAEVRTNIQEPRVGKHSLPYRGTASIQNQRTFVGFVTATYWICLKVSHCGFLTTGHIGSPAPTPFGPFGLATNSVNSGSKPSLFRELPKIPHPSWPKCLRNCCTPFATPPTREQNIVVLLNGHFTLTLLTKGWGRGGCVGKWCRGDDLQEMLLGKGDESQ